MDYMNLGIKSRKTGLSVRNGISKDEFSMENVEEFFRDDNETPSRKRESFIKKRRQSGRKSSLLSINPHIMHELSSPHIFSPSTRRSSILFGGENSGIMASLPVAPPPPPSQQQQQQQQQQGIDSAFETPRKASIGQPLEIIKEEEEKTYGLKLRRPSSLFNRYRTSYGLGDSKLAPTSINSNELEIVKEEQEQEQYNEENDRQGYSNPYTDIPDLVFNDNDNGNDNDITIDNTTLNTSDNAILEDEIDNDNNNNDLDSDISYYSDEEIDLDELRQIPRGRDSDYSSGEEDIKNANIENELLLSDNDESYIPSSDSERDNGYINKYRTPSSYGINEKSEENGSGSEDDVEAYVGSQLLGKRNNEVPLRKSMRVKVPPLEYWRNEKIVYKRKSAQPVLDITKIITIDKEDEEDEEEAARKLRRKNQRSSNTTLTDTAISSLYAKRPVGRPRKQVFSRNDTSNSDNNKMSSVNERRLPITLSKITASETRNGEWLKDGMLRGLVDSSVNHTTTRDIIAYAPGVYQVEKAKQTNEEKYSLAITFDKHKDLFASGVLKLPVSGNRTMTDSKNAFITFYLIQGIVEIRLGNNKFITTGGCTFQIPAFNKYSFKNKGSTEAQLFFTQVIVPEVFDSQKDDRIVGASDSELDTDDHESSTEQKRRRRRRSSSSSISQSSSMISSGAS